MKEVQPWKENQTFLVPAWQVGKGTSDGNRYAKYILAPCVDCGQRR